MFVVSYPNDIKAVGLCRACWNATPIEPSEPRTARRRLFAVPRHITFVESLAEVWVGKILRRELRDAARSCRTTGTNEAADC
jgi:acyl-coenzyme A synthetase/AMP-(fatty) acid ligase